MGQRGLQMSQTGKQKVLPGGAKTLRPVRGSRWDLQNTRRGTHPHFLQGKGLMVVAPGSTQLPCCNEQTLLVGQFPENLKLPPRSA